MSPDDEKLPAPRRISDHLARDLDSAREGSWVYVDPQGRVRSPLRYKLLRGVSLVAIGVAACLPVAYGALFGPVGAVVGLGLVAFVGIRTYPALQLRRAAELIEDDQFEAARGVLQRIADSRTAPRLTRATARANLGIVAARLGEYEEALEQIRSALPGYPRGRRRPLAGHMADYLEIQTLANLGRLGEAREALERRGAAPRGEYLRVLHWSVELYLCLCAGEHDLDADDLHERARKGLAMNTGGALIALTAWAHQYSGDDDQADHLAGEARARLSPRLKSRLGTSMPRLVEWIEGTALGSGGDQLLLQADHSASTSA